MSSKTIRTGIYFLVVFSILAFRQDTAKVDFKDLGFKKALALSRKLHKPLFIYIGTDHCDECHKMKSVFENPDVAQYYNENYISVKMDPDNIGNNLRITDWGLYQTPSFVYMNNRKYIYYSMSGAQTSQEILAVGKKVIKNIKEF